MSKPITILTEILIAIMLFTAGVAVMYQWDLHHPPKRNVVYDICERTSSVVGASFSASSEVEKAVADKKAAEAKKVATRSQNPVEMIYAEAAINGVDPELAVAIAKLETGHFTSDAFKYGNNVGGLSDAEVPRTYNSLEEGVTAFIDTLETYVANGLTTPETIASTYCPSSTTWASTVRALM